MPEWLNKITNKNHKPDNSENEIIIGNSSSGIQPFPEELKKTTDAETADDYQAEPENKPSFKDFCKKYKKGLTRTAIAVGGIAIIYALIAVVSIFLDPLYGYTQSSVEQGTIISSANVSGVLEVNERYNISSLVSGKILERRVELGDRVREGEILYKLDDSEAQLSLMRAENQLEKTKITGSSSASATGKIYATENGTIQSLAIRSGSSVSAGQVVATITKDDGTVSSVVSVVSGTVSSVNVSTGRSVSAGTLIASVKDSSAELTQKTNPYDQKSDQYDVDFAKSQLENYIIKAPTSGIITEVNAKTGDNVSIGNSEPMMVIVDDSVLKFNFQVDETEIINYKKGQDVVLTSDSFPEETFVGAVSFVGTEGKRNDAGKLMFDVSVTIEETGDLKAGMNVEARVIFDYSTEALHVPNDALLKIDDNNALVLVKDVEHMPEDKSSKTTIPSDTELAYPTIEVPKGCTLLEVRYGITDGTKTEILSGIVFGDIVVYNPEWKDIVLPVIPEEGEENSDEIIPGLPKKKPAKPALPVESDIDEEDEKLSSEGNEPALKSDDEIRNEIKDRVQMKQGEIPTVKVPTQNSKDII